MKILALIPARGGSKGIPNKNIKDFKGKPLIAWSIKNAHDSKYINRTILSSDSNEIIKIADSCYCEAPFVRPSEISQDLSIDYEFVIHCLDWLKTNQNYVPDMIVQLRPTYPTRKTCILDECIAKFIENFKEYDSLRTVIPIEKTPYKTYRIKNGVLEPLFEEVDGIKKPYDKCRQVLPETFAHNGYIDIMKTESVYRTKSVSGDKILPFVMNRNEYHDIDTIQHWTIAEKM